MHLGHATPASSLADRRRLREPILAHTTLAAARLCPEIRLRLVTAECPLWKASEEEAARSGLVEPYWAFSWAGGQALARHLLDHPELVRNKRVLDFGAGGAVEGIAAALVGACVLANDIDPMATEAALVNAELNGVSLEVTTENLVGVVDPSWDVVLCGDVFYGTEMAAPALAWLRALARRGADVLVGDPDRGFLDVTGLDAVARVEAPADNDADGSFLRPTTIYRVRPA
ncbi:MAG TPA: 50S ribosomal protein L11 methyltransferase [Polyangiaceae bacterium]|nr:50S ribosomal protein L11 methyltransferase [Polyangiaceae bacterium]